MTSFENKKIPVPDRNLGFQQIVSCEDVVYHGQLRKRRSVDKVLNQMKAPLKWKQIFVVLRGGCIYFYNNETSTKPRATSLYGFTSVERCSSHEIPKDIPWPFRLVCALELRDRDFYFSAASEKDLVIWLKHIEQQITYANGFAAGSVGKTPPVALAQPLQKTNPQFSRGLPKLPDVSGKKEQLSVNNDLIYIIDSSSSDEDSDTSTKEANSAQTKTLPEVPSQDKTRAKKMAVKPMISTGPTISRRINDHPTQSNSKPTTAAAAAGPAATAAKAPTTPKPPGPKKPAVTSKPTGQSGPIAAATVLTQDSKKADQQKSSDVEVYTDGCIYDCQRDYLDLGVFNQDSLESAVADAFWKKGPTEAEEMMKSMDSPGAYMIRESSSDKGSHTLMVCTGKGVCKYKVFHIDNKFSLESIGPYFGKMAELIAHYKTNFLPQRDLKLTKPYSFCNPSGR